jgi:hypothetical protein
MSSSLARVGSAPGFLAAGVAEEELDWDRFSTRYFPGRRRHDLEALASYAAYKHGREWRKSPPRLTLVPAEPLRPPDEAEWDGAAERRLLFAVSAVQVWEGEGGFTP